MNTYFNEKNIHTVDVKGRVILSKEIRDHHGINKGDVLYCLPSLENPTYVEIRTAPQWERYFEALAKADEGEEKKLSYRFASIAHVLATVDGQGRISIPQKIREACRIEETVAVVDMGKHIEIWAKEHIDQKYEEMVRAFKKLNDKIF
jgi:DNA-binding transcriptional regulator/RsmH inhibitor MraZ